MSWSINEFTAVSVEAAKRECERAIGGVAEKEKVLGIIGAVLDLAGVYPNQHIYVRGYGHSGGNGGGNFFLEVKPASPPKA